MPSIILKKLQFFSEKKCKNFKKCMFDMKTFAYDTKKGVGGKFIYSSKF